MPTDAGGCSKPAFKSVFFACLFCCTLLLIASGCASSRAPKAGSPNEIALVWPDPPLPARIAYIQSISRPSDLGIKRPVAARFAGWITGSQRGNEPLIKPFGIAVDEMGNLCVTDTAANAVCYFDRVKKKWRRWEKIGKIEFVAPVGIAKQKGIFFVADSGLARVLAFDENGKLLFDIREHLERPSGLAIAAERLFVTDSLRHCVVSFNLGGNYLSEFGRRGAGAGEFNFPTHIAADSDGNLFVTDSMNSRIQVFGINGEAKGQIGSAGDASGYFSRPKGIGLDSRGHIYVADAMFDNIQIFDRAGRFLLYIGEAGRAAGQFWLPNGIAISRDNEIFVADSYNRRVQVFKYIGQP